MSNWSVVSISFSGLESISIEAVQAVLGEELRWMIVPACDDPEAPGGAVEWWMTTHVNHFDIDDWLPRLCSLEWELPEEVCVIWKDEFMEIPRIYAAFK